MIGNVQWSPLGKVDMVGYSIPDPPSKLPHRRMNLLEWLASLIMQSHVCQICGRKEIWSVKGWFAIGHPKYKDKNGCSVVCNICCEMNRDVFHGRGIWD